MLDTDELEICPNCGRDGKLRELTGWCTACTLAHHPDYKECSCGALYKKRGHFSRCWSCRKESWLTEHADSIEDELAKGLGIYAAKKAVADKLRPTCEMCGEEIRGGRQNSVFCNKKSECCKASYVYLKLRQTGLSPDVALQIAVDRVTVLR